MENFLDFASTRYSVRKFQSKPVEKEKIEKILKAAQIAPTARNSQPQKIYVVTSKENLDKLSAVTPCIYDAPLVFVIGYTDDRVCSGKVYDGYNFGDTDVSIVCTHMMLEAHDLGVGSCWVGWFNEKELRDALELPSDYHIRDLLVCGYEDESYKASDMHSQKRKIDDFVEFI